MPYILPFAASNIRYDKACMVFMFVYAKQRKNVIPASLCASNLLDTSNVIDFMFCQTKQSAQRGLYVFYDRNFALCLSLELFIHPRNNFGKFIVRTQSTIHKWPLNPIANSWTPVHDNKMLAICFHFVSRDVMKWAAMYKLFSLGGKHYVYALCFRCFCVNVHKGVCRKCNLGNLFGVKVLVSMKSILVVLMINIFTESCRNYDQIYSLVCLFTEC